VGALPSQHGCSAHPPVRTVSSQLSQRKNKNNRPSRNLAYMKYILIVDDSPLIRRSLRTLFDQQPNWAICAEAENGREGIDKAQTLHPDLILLDLAMPRLNGIDASRILKRLMPATPIVMFTTFTNPFIKEAALAAGVQAVVDKSEGATTLIRSIQQLLTSELPPCSPTAAK
jgi:DNA-binding NarL/FixJ family response regulator